MYTYVHTDLPALQFVKIFRLLRVMRLDGKYLEAFSVFDDIYAEQKDLLSKSGFVGAAVWVILSGMYDITCIHHTYCIPIK